MRVTEHGGYSLARVKNGLHKVREKANMLDTLFMVIHIPTLTSLPSSGL